VVEFFRKDYSSNCILVFQIKFNSINKSSSLTKRNYSECMRFHVCQIATALFRSG
jgi:hypothetical protein